MFGIFFILAAHEHYSIDVFVAFYITSRLFLYYHTLANNQALMSRDSTRTRIWFPMFSYFESSVDGIIPNEYDTMEDVLCKLFSCLLYLKDMCMLTARRFWITHNHLSPKSSISSKRPSRHNIPSNSSSIDKNLNNKQQNLKKLPDTINLILTNNEIRTNDDIIKNVESESVIPFSKKDA